MSRAVVAGVGSPAPGDRIGWAVLDRVAARPEAGAAVLHRLDRPASALVTVLAGAERGVVVDAAVADEPPGTVLRLSGTDALGVNRPLSSHGFGVAEALALGQALGDLPERLVVIGVVVADAETSPPEGTAERAAEAVAAELAAGP